MIHQVTTKAGRKTRRKVWAAASEMSHISTGAIMRVTGITSTSVVAFHLQKLVELGYITRGPAPLACTWRVAVPLITIG